MTGDYFVYALMSLNFGAMVCYAWEGNAWKALYWASVILLNYSLLRMR